MLESIRTHRRWMMFFLLALVFPSFVITGIYGYSRFVDSDNAVARIGGKPITAQEFDAAQRQRLDQLRQMLGENFDPSLLDSAQARAATVNALLAQRALQLEAARTHMGVSTDRLREVIAAIPAFQQDGRFDYERYRALLAAQGKTEIGFERELQDEIVRQLLLQGVATSALAPRTVIDRINAIAEERREVRELVFDPAAFRAAVKIDEQALKDYYESNRASFETPESVDAEYVVLTLEDIAAQISVPEAELRTYYEQNKARFGQDEQRRARHILVAAGEGGNAGDRAAARSRAEEVLQRVRARPQDFARIAREESNDPGSAANGGDLGLFGRNMFVKPFEETAFALKAGEISDVVETEFGFHIIQVTEIVAAQARPFEEVRAQIEREFRTQQAQRRFAEAAEQFTNTVYEQADSLAPVAEKLNLNIQRIAGLTQAGPPATPAGQRIFTPRVLQSVFSAESVRARRNTEAIEIGPNMLVSVRVIEHRPRSVRPFEEVRQEVRDQLVRQQAARLAREAGEARLAALRSAPSDAGFSATRTVSRLQPQGVPEEAVKAIMRVPADALPAYVGVELDSGAYAVFRVSAARMPDSPDAQQREATSRAVVRQLGAADDDAFLKSLKAKYRAEILRADLRAAHGDAAPSGR